MTDKGRILVVEDDEFVCNSLKWLLMDEGYAVEVTTDGRQALEVLSKDSFDLVITDLMMPEVSGLEVLKEAKSRSAETSVIVLTGYGTVEAAVSAMEQGAFDFLTKPCDDLEMKFKIVNALETKRLKDRVRELTERGARDAERLANVEKTLKGLCERIESEAGGEAGEKLSAALEGLKHVRALLEEGQDGTSCGCEN